MNLNKRSLGCAVGFSFAGTLMLLASIWFNPMNHYLNSLALVVGAVVIYFGIVFLAAQRNWLDIRAVFSGTWIATIGLATLRLTDYQEPWQTETWVLVALTYGFFQLGANVGIILGRKYSSQVRQKAKHFHIGKVRFAFQENRLFYICVITTLIGLTCFLINVAIKGFVPCFSKIFNAYTVFYTKWHVFAVASTGVSGLCYYCIRTQKLGFIKKAILWICLIYLVLVFPVLVVSRGVFIVAALSLSVAVFYLHKRSIVIFVLCLAVMFGVYMFSSNLRNYSDSQLETFFEPSNIEIQKPTQPGTTGGDQTETPEDSKTYTFTLSPKMAFLYSYITVSHDNLNEAVKYREGYTWGLRQLQPFNVLLRIPAVTQAVENAEYYQVNPYLTTTNLVGDFYYDFGILGVAICMLLWAVIFGAVQGFYESDGGVFSLLILGNTMVPVALCFFSTWLSVFSHWMLWGVAILFALAACITTRQPEENRA